MIKRPKPGEGEEELLRMQEEYLREKSEDPNYKPAAQFSRIGNEHTKRSVSKDTGTKKVSKYAQSKGLTGRAEKRAHTEAPMSSVMGDILEKNIENVAKEQKPSDEDDKVYFPSVIPSILGSIIEKNLDIENYFEFPPMPSQGFPEVKKRDLDRKSVPTPLLEMEQTHSKMEIDSCNSETSKISIKKPENLPSQSYIITSQDASDIHNENIKVLSSMSEKEILEEKQKLLQNLDPKLVDFMKAKRYKKTCIKSNITENKCKNNVEEMDTSESLHQSPLVEKPDLTKEKTLKITRVSQEPQLDCLWDNDVLSHPEVKNWLNFDSLEKDKLEWMKGIQESKILNPDEPYEARFDFQGYLLPYTVEYTEKTKSLFHHGEEPHRPGYTLNELIELSRSSITQQRVMALNTLAGILEYHSAGTYKDVIELPLSKIFFIIRIAMDENKISILEPALKAMRNLIYNRIDEASLDALIGFEEGTIQPSLENDKSEIEELESKESELKDFHLAEIDLISAILRTDILQRLYYILDSIRPSLNCVQYSLQILTRLVRDSTETAMKIVQFDHLMRAIIKNFIPRTGVNFVFDPQMVYKGRPILSAVRLFRILSLQAEEIGSILIDKYEILQPISTYISSEVDRSYGLRIQIEAYCLLSNLLHYRLGIDTAMSLLPIVTTTLYKHIQGTDIFITSSIVSITHASVILQLINRILRQNSPVIDECKTQLYPLLIEGMQKWITQISQADSFTCAHLRLLCSALDCSYNVQFIDYPVKMFIDFLKQLSLTKGFNMILKNLIPSSNLLSGLDNSNLHTTKNLMTLGGAVIDSTQKVLPILNVQSPLPFLLSLFKVLTNMNDKILAESYLLQVTPYLNKLAKKMPALSDNWFTRMEGDFVFNILKLSLQTDVSESDKDLLYVVANKLCYIFRTDKRYEVQFLFEKIVFNKDWFTAERLLHLVSISHSEGLSNALMSIDEIRQCYSKAINLNHRDTGPNVILLRWREPILPRDWIYLPILMMYSRRNELESAPKVIGEHSKKVTELAATQKKSIIASSLEWILFNELCFPDLLSDINVTDRFCRIMCVFLCDNGLFLEGKIKVLLQKCVLTLFKKKVDLDFDRPLVGLHNFQDFYTEFLEQFQSVSYGDSTFAACVLVPLAQKHNVKWRKLIWSEYAGCLRALDCPEELLCYDLNDYFYPEESDESLIKSYFRALSSNLLRPDTVAHKIAKHHVECFKLRTKSMYKDE